MSNDFAAPVHGPAARVTITIEIGNDPRKPHVTVAAPDGTTPQELANALDTTREYVAQMQSLGAYHAVAGTLPLTAASPRGRDASRDGGPAHG